MLVVEDDDDVRALLRIVLGDHAALELVGEAASGADGIALASTASPDVVVVDLGLPDLAGHEVLTRLRAASPGSRVVVYTGQDAPADALRADRYVRKGEAIGRLVDAVVEAARIEGTTASLDVPADPAATPVARRFVADQLGSWDAGALADDALLVVSELVTNAIIHARSACRVDLRLAGEVLDVAVTDFGPGTPEPQPPSTTRPGGRGLALVSALSTAWGVDPVAADRGDGKVVWARLSAPSPS